MKKVFFWIEKCRNARNESSNDIKCIYVWAENYLYWKEMRRENDLEDLINNFDCSAFWNEKADRHDFQFEFSVVKYVCY